MLFYKKALDLVFRLFLFFETFFRTFYKKNGCFKDAPAARTLVFEHSGWGPPPLLRIFYFLPPPPPLLISPTHVLGTPATQLRQYFFFFLLVKQVSIRTFVLVKQVN